jgi:hypothetical protein
MVWLGRSVDPAVASSGLLLAASTNTLPPLNPARKTHQTSRSLDEAMQSALHQSRAVLKGRGPGGGGGNGSGSHLWLRLALISQDKSAATLFDDLTQVGLARVFGACVWCVCVCVWRTCV